MPLSDDDQRKLIEAQILISQSLNGINNTLKTINDQNILHSAKVTEEHKGLMDKIQRMTVKYWYLILILVLALIVLAGVEKFPNLP